MKRTRAYYRRQRNRAIERKLGILRRLGGEEYVYACPMCRAKSRDEHSHRDKKAFLSAKQQMDA